MLKIQTIAIFALLLSVHSKAIGAFEELGQELGQRRTYVSSHDKRSAEEIKKLPQSTIDDLEERLKNKGVWEIYKNAGGDLAKVADPVQRQRIRLALMPLLYKR